MLGKNKRRPTTTTFHHLCLKGTQAFICVFTNKYSHSQWHSVYWTK